MLSGASTPTQGASRGSWAAGWAILALVSLWEKIQGKSVPHSVNSPLMDALWELGTPGRDRRQSYLERGDRRQESRAQGRRPAVREGRGRCEGIICSETGM